MYWIVSLQEKNVHVSLSALNPKFSRDFGPQISSCFSNELHSLVKDLTLLGFFPISNKIFRISECRLYFTCEIDPDDICNNIVTYAYYTTLCSYCEQASDLWQQIELASEHEPDLQDG